MVQKYPDMSTPIRSKLSELQDSWRQLQTLCSRRRDQLTSAFTRHKFLADLKELDLWVADTIKKMTSSELPNNVAEAEALLELHNERKVGLMHAVADKCMFKRY